MEPQATGYPGFDQLLFRVEIAADGKRFRVGWHRDTKRIYTTTDLGDGRGERLTCVSPAGSVSTSELTDGIYEDLDRAIRTHAPLYVVPRRTLEGLAAHAQNRAEAVVTRDATAVDDVRSRLARWFVNAQRARRMRLCHPRIMEALLINANAANTRAARVGVKDALSEIDTLTRWEELALAAWAYDDHSTLAFGLAGLSQSGCEHCAVASMTLRRVTLCDDCQPEAS